MDPTQAPPKELSLWYSSSGTPEIELPFEPAQAAFKEGVRIFRDSLTNDPEKKQLAEQLLARGTIHDVVEAVAKAKSHYESGRGTSKMRECLSAFSQRLLYYGNVMDVLVSHHPEYVALVWGAMKFIFGAVVEHERTGLQIVTAFCDISNSLPTVQLAIQLYPTAMMTHAVSTLYSHIVQLLIRIWRYYEESKLMRAIHSITRPAALRYDDLITLVQRDTETVRKHATAISQAEIRDIHHGIRSLRAQLDSNSAISQTGHQATQTNIADLVDMMAQMRRTMDFERAVSASAQLQIRTALSDVQLRQALAMISSQCIIDHKSAFQSAMQLSSSRPFGRKSQHDSYAFWGSPKLQDWNGSQDSSAILLKSTFRERLQVRGFCTEVVDYLKRSSTAVLWVLMDRGQAYPLVEALKSLVFQALSLGYTSPSEDQMTFELSKYMDAHFVDDYVNLLASLLRRLRLVYIVVNAEAMAPDTALECRSCLRQLSRILLERGSKTVLKVIVTSHGPERQGVESFEDLVLSIGKGTRQTARRQFKNRTRKFRSGHLDHSSAIRSNPNVSTESGNPQKDFEF